jgi:hypothetical protein
MPKTYCEHIKILQEYIQNVKIYLSSMLLGTTIDNQLFDFFLMFSYGF